MTSLLRLVALVVATGASGVALGAGPQVPQVRDIRPQAARPTELGTGAISGTVSMAGSGQPARRVRVSLSGVEIRGNRTATTDDQGRFSFTGLPAGRYSLSASRPGHVTVTYGQRQPGRPGTLIQLGDGQKFTASLQIPKGSVITGMVLDEHGEPSPQTQVRVMRVVVSNGQRRLQGTNSATTDDRGIYRVFGLLPGDYVVCATPRNTSLNDADRMRMELQGLQRALEAAARTTDQQERAIRDRIDSLQTVVAALPTEESPSGYAPVCYPGAISSSGATPIPLTVAEERVGVDFQLHLAPLARVDGSVINASGAQVRTINLTLSELNPLGPAMANMSARADGEGRFQFNSVPPGQYRLTARATAVPAGPAAPAGGRGGRGGPQSNSVTVWASTDVVVDGRSLSNVMLTLQPGLSVSGQVVFSGGTPPPTDLSRIRVTASPADPGAVGGGSSVTTDANGRFTLQNIVPGRYRFSASGAGGWSVESADVRGQDALDFPAEVGGQNISGVVITMTDQQTELTGVVTDEANAPVTDYTLVIFPSDEQYWGNSPRRVQSTRPSTDGRYTFRGLPPGDYRLATVLDLDPGATSDPAFLQQLEATSMPISLQRGEKKVQDIRLR